jgi:hypothetical protein
MQGSLSDDRTLQSDWAESPVNRVIFGSISENTSCLAEAKVPGANPHDPHIYNNNLDKAKVDERTVSVRSGDIY